jgi:AcrR family transcriptional regulator
MARRRKMGAEETRERLVEAVVRLLARRSVADLSVKEIAAEAGVNHGLVHRYFGSKENLVRDAIARTNARVSANIPEVATTRWTYDLLRENPELARILARCCLDGPRDLLAAAKPPADRVELHSFQIGEALTRFHLSGMIDPKVVNALGLAAILGWIVFRPLFDAGYRLPADADRNVETLIDLVDDIIFAPPRE